MDAVLVPALSGVTFDVSEEEFLAIFGPSGSGDYKNPWQRQGTIFSIPRSQSLSISPIFTLEWTIAAFAMIVCLIFELYVAKRLRN